MPPLTAASKTAARVPAAIVWRRWLTPAARLPVGLAVVLALALLFAALRFIAVLGVPGVAPVRWLMPLSMSMMMATPWLLLTPLGRRAIGLTPPRALWQFVPALLLGAAAALACHLLGMTVFGTSADNWFVTIAASYRATMNTAPLSLTTLYLVFTVPALIFSPLGEEIFFRGILQRSLETRYSVRTSTIIECATFGLVHLCHHGLVLGANGLSVRPLSAMLWAMSMFSVALLFATVRRRSDSLYPAMAAHAAFNAAMNALILTSLW